MKITLIVSLLSLGFVSSAFSAECTAEQIGQGGQTKDFINGSKICLMPRSGDSQYYVCAPQGCSLVAPPNRAVRMSDGQEIPEFDLSKEEI